MKGLGLNRYLVEVPLRQPLTTTHSLVAVKDVCMICLLSVRRAWLEWSDCCQILSLFAVHLSRYHHPSTSHHIKHCFQLDKYSNALKHPRPLLIKLNCFIDVADILSRRTLFPPSSNVYIKPHLSQSERKQEQILLKDRRLLVNAGIHHRAIKLHGDKLYVDNKIRGQILDSIFVKCATTSSEATDVTTLEPCQLPLANTHADQINNFPASFASMMSSNPSPTTWLSSHKVNCFHWNCSSTVNKLKSFQCFAYPCCFDIIAFTETWLPEKIYKAEIFPSGYTLYCSARCSRGEGVRICVSTHLSSRSVLPHPPLTWLLLKPCCQPVFFCCVYVPPKLLWSIYTQYSSNSTNPCSTVSEFNYSWWPKLSRHLPAYPTQFYSSLCCFVWLSLRMQPWTVNQHT